MAEKKSLSPISQFARCETRKNFEQPVACAENKRTLTYSIPRGYVWNEAARMQATLEESGYKRFFMEDLHEMIGHHCEEEVRLMLRSNSLDAYVRGRRWEFGEDLQIIIVTDDPSYVASYLNEECAFSY